MGMRVSLSIISYSCLFLQRIRRVQGQQLAWTRKSGKGLNRSKHRCSLQNYSPEGDRLQNGTDQVTFSGGGFEAHEGSTSFGIIQRGLWINKVNVLKVYKWKTDLIKKTRFKNVWNGPHAFCIKVKLSSLCSECSCTVSLYVALDYTAIRKVQGVHGDFAITSLHINYEHSGHTLTKASSQRRQRKKRDTQPVTEIKWKTLKS